MLVDDRSKLRWKIEERKDVGRMVRHRVVDVVRSRLIAVVEGDGAKYSTDVVECELMIVLRNSG
jgi:hypothetical protein